MTTLVRHPAWSALAFLVVGVFAVTFLSPGGDMQTPAIGGVIVVVLSVALYLWLRRQPSG
jgi:hypothetical protein